MDMIDKPNYSSDFVSSVGNAISNVGSVISSYIAKPAGIAALAIGIAGAPSAASAYTKELPSLENMSTHLGSDSRWVTINGVETYFSPAVKWDPESESAVCIDRLTGSFYEPGHFTDLLGQDNYRCDIKIDRSKGNTTESAPDPAPADMGSTPSDNGQVDKDHGDY